MCAGVCPSIAYLWVRSIHAIYIMLRCSNSRMQIVHGLFHANLESVLVQSIHMRTDIHVLYCHSWQVRLIKHSG